MTARKKRYTGPDVSPNDWRDGVIDICDNRARNPSQRFVEVALENVPELIQRLYAELPVKSDLNITIDEALKIAAFAIETVRHRGWVFSMRGKDGIKDEWGDIERLIVQISKRKEKKSTK